MERAGEVRRSLSLSVPRFTCSARISDSSIDAQVLSAFFPPLCIRHSRQSRLSTARAPPALALALVHPHPHARPHLALVHPCSNP